MSYYLRSAAFFLNLCLAFEVNGFDYIVFSEQYPPGYCRSTFKGKCIEAKVKQNFTIHGLWPSVTGDKAEQCDRSKKFDVKEVQTIKESLEEAWPSFRTNDPTTFWAHEWKKHGSCGMNSPELSGVFQYFNTTLALHNRFNLLEFLGNDGIVPSTTKSYEFQQIQDALKNDLQGRANLVCDRAQGFDYPILTEVRYCLDKELNVVDCPLKKERCGKSRIFLLPTKRSAASGTEITTQAEANFVSVFMLGLAIVFFVLPPF